jgi:hypothetical protein
MSELHERDNQGLSEQVQQLASTVEKQDVLIGLLIDGINRLSAEVLGKATPQDIMNAIGEYVPAEIRGSSIDGVGDILVNMGGRAVWDTIETAGGSSVVPFSGTYWFKGKRYALAGTAKAYWYHNVMTDAGSWSDGPVPSPMPDSQYWRYTSACRPIEYIMC